MAVVDRQQSHAARSEADKSETRTVPTTFKGTGDEGASTHLTEPKTIADKVTVALWENSVGPNWRKYHKYIRVLPCVDYKDPKLEAAYGKYVKDTYTFRNALCGLTSVIVLLPIWIIPSVLMRRNLDENGLNGLLTTYDGTYRILYDVIMAISLVASLILMFSHSIPQLRNNPEETFYVIALVPFLLLSAWEMGVLVSGFVHRDEFKLGGKQSADGAMQFKFWTDLLTLVLMFMLIVFLDLLMNTRTIYSMWIHLLILFTYALVRLFILGVFKDPTTDENMPSVILTQTLQFVFYCSLCFFAYLSRQQKEMAERAAFLDIKFDQDRLQELRQKQNKKRSKGQSLQEKLIDIIKKAQTGLQVAAFERSTQGEVALLERDEVLRQACEIAMDAEDLFAVGAAGREGDDQDEVLNIYGKKGAARVASGQRKTAEDKLTVPFDQQEFFTGDILPNFAVQSEIKKHAGQMNSTALKILDIAEQDPHLLVKVALTLIAPVEDELRSTQTHLTKFFYELERRYHPNPYHNSIHGAMVGHMTISILRSLGIYDVIDKQALTALVIASIGHDVGHPGLNNNYFVNSQSLLTRIYNDNAVLENYHSFLVFRFAQISPEVNVFQNLAIDEWREMRQNIIEFILVTDMSQHFGIISKFRVRRTSDKFDIKENIEDQQIVAKLCIKMGDLSHSVVEWPHHLEWSFRVTKEFYIQGDLERASKLPISPLCDRATHPDFAKSQAGFLHFVVTPLAAELSEIDQTGVFLNDVMNKLLFNKHKWELMREKRDDLPLPQHIDKMEVAPPNFAEASLFLALRAKTVDDINSDPMEKLDILEVLGHQQPAGNEAAEEEEGSEEEEEDEEESEEESSEEESDEEESSEEETSEEESSAEDTDEGSEAESSEGSEETSSEGE